MRITKIEDLHAKGRGKDYSFLKVSTDEGLVGWSEFSEMNWNPGLGGVIRKLSEHLIGRDPRAFGLNSGLLYTLTRMSTGGLIQQAIAAIENACVDIAAKAANAPVYRLFGGPYRQRIDLYWSHCGSAQVRNPQAFQEMLGMDPITRVEDFETLGREVIARGFRACKTNIVLFEDGPPRMINSGFQPGFDLGHKADAHLIGIVDAQLAAFRAGLGPEAGLHLDVNFAFRPEGLRRVARACEPHKVSWLEADIHNPQALAAVRRDTSTPIASLETIYGRRAFKSFLEADAVDVAIIDVPWNGIAEAVRIAGLAESYEVNVAPHNFTGPLACVISAHFCAAVPNFQIMEFDIDNLLEKNQFLTHEMVVENGQIVVSDRPGWGTDIDEDALRRHASDA